MPLRENHDSEDAIDVALMMRVKHGDQDAFEQIVARYQDVAVGTVAKMLGNPSNAQDIAQQAFVRLWNAAPRYKNKAKFSTYFFTIIRNLVFNESKKIARRKTYSLQQREEVLFEQLPDAPNKIPDAEVQQHELSKVVDQAIANLPPKQRLALVLRRYENTPYEEIAVVLKTSVSAVKSHLFRARTTLKEELSSYLS